MKNISKIISIVFLSFSILLLCYVFYRSEFFHFGTRSSYYFKFQRAFKSKSQYSQKLVLIQYQGYFYQLIEFLVNRIGFEPMTPSLKINYTTTNSSQIENNFTIDRRFMNLKAYIFGKIRMEKWTLCGHLKHF